MTTSPIIRTITEDPDSYPNDLQNIVLCGAGKIYQAQVLAGTILVMDARDPIEVYQGWKWTDKKLIKDVFSGTLIPVERERLENLRNLAAAIGSYPKLQSKEKMVELGQELFELARTLLQQGEDNG